MIRRFKLISLFIIFATVKFAYAEMSLSGYTEFVAGSADQSTHLGVDNQGGYDKAGLDNGTYSRVTANYSSTLDSGIDVAGTMNLTTRDCQGDKTDNCNVTNFNFVTFSGGFGSVSIGERFAAGAVMLSRMTATVILLLNQMVLFFKIFILLMVLMFTVLLTSKIMQIIQ